MDLKTYPKGHRLQAYTIVPEGIMAKSLIRNYSQEIFGGWNIFEKFFKEIGSS